MDRLEDNSERAMEEKMGVREGNRRGRDANSYSDK